MYIKKKHVPHLKYFWDVDNGCYQNPYRISVLDLNRSNVDFVLNLDQGARNDNLPRISISPTVSIVRSHS